MPDHLTLLLVTDVFPPRCGGSGWSTYHLARALRSRGHRVLIARPREGLQGSQLTEYDAFPVHELGYTARGRQIPFVRGVVRQERFWPQFGHFLADLARREQVDLLHGQHLISIPATVRAGQVLGRPTVATVRDYWPTCPIGTRLPHCPETARCSAACQVCCLTHGRATLRPFVRAALPYVAANLQRRQQALRDADATVAVSNYVAQILRTEIPGLVPRVLPNFIALDDQHEESTPPPPGTDQPTVLFAGKLEPHKGADLLPLAMAAIPQARLLVAGDGPLAGQIAAEAAARNLQLALLGERPHHEVLALMRQADVLLFPARWEEPLTRTLLEAGSLGLPAIALNVGGNSDIILDGQTGLLVDDPEQLGPALATLLAQPVRRAAMAVAAQQQIAGHFSEAVVIPQVEQLYRELLHRRSGAAQ